MNKLLMSIIGSVMLSAAIPALAGDPIPGVDVAIEQVPGGVVYTGNVNEAGQLVFQNLPKGRYRIIHHETETPLPGTVNYNASKSNTSLLNSGSEGDVPNAEDFNSTRSNISGISKPKDKPRRGKRYAKNANTNQQQRVNNPSVDDIPTAEDFNSTRSNISFATNPNNKPRSGRNVRAVSGPVMLKQFSGNKADVLIVNKRGDVVIEFD